jgi:glucose uptake protein GlcU
LIVISFIRKEHLSLKEHSKRDIRLAIFSGALYFCASVFMLLAFKNTASSIAFNIIQLNFVLVVIMGIFVFKEINVKLHWKRIILACLTTILGILILSLARG